MPRKSSQIPAIEVEEESRSAGVKVEKETVLQQCLEFFKNHRTRAVIGVLMVALMVFSTFAVLSFFFTGGNDSSLLDAMDKGLMEGKAARAEFGNMLGILGARLSRWLIDGTFGLVSLLILFMLLMYGLRLMNVTEKGNLRLFFLCAFWIVWGSITLGFLQLLTSFGLFFRLGGSFGAWIAPWLTSYVRPVGTGLLLVVTLVVFLIISDKNFIPRVCDWWERLKERLARKETPTEMVTEPAEEQESVSEEGGNTIDIQIDGVGGKTKTETAESEITVEIEKTGAGDENGMPSLMIEQQSDETGGEGEQDDETDTQEQPSEEKKDGENLTIDDTNAVEIVEQQQDYDPHADLSFYKFPGLELLKVYDNETAPVINQEEQQANAARIVNTLRNYDVEIESIKATVGPTVTLYEVVPKAGTRISKIQNLENDIMLSLSAIGIRIIAPMPGKGTVGIEVPNEKPQVVSMHSVIASKRFQEEQKMKLPVAMGRTITNEVFCFDLAKTPHLLVAGATGQGKSVGLNAIITSLLYKKHPSELKFVLVDPKMVEFSIYKPLIRHYMAAMPDQEDRDIIITDCQKVINTLNSLVIEMEDRYSLLADAGVRNLEDYNEKFIHRNLNPEKVVENLVTKKPLHHHFMPYLVIIIDEYGDFIMQAGKEVERPIQRLAQKARAVGMHMVLATQRPDVKIVTGTIKANVPTRIAFRTQSVVDSRTVLDAKGADQLIGKGDMLYSGGGNMTRIQCAFVDTPEVEAIVQHISDQQHYSMPYQLPEYVPEGGDEGGSVQPGQVDMKRLDPMFADVARYVVNKQEGSTSRLQRAFEIGYNRAGKLSDQLEAAGVVGPNKGPKGRDVLIQDPESLEQLLQTLGV